MTSQDIRTLLYFITRTGMYIPKDEAGYIISFINGFEIGRNNKFDFTEKLSEILEKEYNCKKGSMGWNGQLIEFSKKNDFNWETGFKKLGLKILSKYFVGDSKKEYEKILKSIIQSNIRQIEVVNLKDQNTTINRFGEKWIEKWIGLTSLDAKWFCEIWTTDEFEIISKINEEIFSIENKNQVEIIANERLIQLSRRF